jgi:hypothetical protein
MLSVFMIELSRLYGAEFLIEIEAVAAGSGALAPRARSVKDRA